MLDKPPVLRGFIILLCGRLGGFSFAKRPWVFWFSPFCQFTSVIILDPQSNHPSIPALILRRNGKTIVAGLQVYYLIYDAGRCRDNPAACRTAPGLF